MKRFLMAALIALTASQAKAYDFADNSVSLTYGPTYREPSIQASIPKYTLTFTHFDAGKWGTNFINIDGLFSDRHDPSKGSTGGAVEVYAIYRGNLSGNAVFGGTPFTFGPVKDIRFELGGDFNTKNDFFAPAKKLIVAGPNIAFDVPGYLNVGLHIAHEWNHNGIPGAIRSEVSFDPTFEMEVVWMQPLSFTGLPLKFDGFFNLVAPKGKDGFGNQTATEILTQPRLVLDVGALAMKKPNFIDAYVGYQYWMNKFGNDSNITHAGAIAQTVFVGTSLHF